MSLHGQPSKPAPTSMLHSQELGWSSSAVLTNPKVAANSPSVDGDNHSSLPDLEPAWACTSGFSLEHCCPAPPEESEALSHSELESVPGANVSTDIYLPLKCIGVFLNLFTTALPGHPLPQQLTASLFALMWVLEILKGFIGLFNCWNGGFLPHTSILSLFAAGMHMAAVACC